MSILKKVLEIDEGFRANMYKCTAGKRTIGIGRNLDDVGLTHIELAYLMGNQQCDIDDLGYVYASGGIDFATFEMTQEQAYYLLENDIQTAITGLIRVFRDHSMPIVTSNPRHIALISMMFNLGYGRFRGFKKMILAVKNDDWDEASVQAKDSRWYKQVGSRGKRLCYTLQTGRLPSAYSEG